jgi:exopolysaccharide biosynthesis polyprenyl glycosylphosphotransferase
VSNVVGEPLVDISKADMSESTINIKRVSDIIVSIFVLILISPLLLTLAILIKLDSKGPIIYKQTRIGYHKKPFNIYKFRSMKVDAEANGPTLSSLDDPRITKLGKILRKYRLDELPQFWNVVKGDMSLVGPRPEREFYIKQIITKAPYYSLIHQVRPGITSWGMVKFGYASNVDEMISRLRYDLLYIENVSFAVDLKILFYTINTVLTGKGV